MPFQELALREWNAAENPKCRKFARATQFNSTTSRVSCKMSLNEEFVSHTR